jgi:hypothetical protein
VFRGSFLLAASLFILAAAEGDGPVLAGREITCSCGAPLRVREGGLVLKYFRVKRPSVQAPRGCKASVTRLSLKARTLSR